MAESGGGDGMRSGELARRAGVSADTLAYYERKGLLAKPRRLPNGYRAYSPESLDRVQLIQRALAVGFTLTELARLLRARDRGHPPCHEVRALADRKLADVESQLVNLERFRDVLRRIILDWDARLANTKPREAARLLESLAALAGDDEPDSPIATLAFARRTNRKGKP
jgi:DNA-binding transcriptional MerR regulator